MRSIFLSFFKACSRPLLSLGAGVFLFIRFGLCLILKRLDLPPEGFPVLSTDMSRSKRNKRKARA